MQQPAGAAPAIPWHDILMSPAFWLATLAALVRWVIAPAVVRYMRDDLRPELQKIADVAQQFPAMKRQLDDLDCVPTRLERIETLLELALKKEGHSFLSPPRTAGE